MCVLISKLLLAEAEDDEIIEYLEEALANLSFTEDMEEFDLLALTRMMN